MRKMRTRSKKGNPGGNIQGPIEKQKKIGASSLGHKFGLDEFVSGSKRTSVPLKREGG